MFNNGIVNQPHKFIHIFKKNFSDTESNKPSKKVIVFDLDETIGSFADLKLLWDMYLPHMQTQTNFDCLFDLYPEFLRYGILSILEFLFHKKKSGECSKIMIYTNNQYSPIWPELIIHCLNRRLSDIVGEPVELFDQIICAFKVNNRIVEIGRTTHKKTYSDFIRCTMLSKSTEICFVDNTGYNSMKCDRVYYIQPRAYTHSISGAQIAERFLTLADIVKELGDFDAIILALYGKFHNRVVDQPSILADLERDIIVSQKMMYYIKEFFYMRYVKKRYTKKMMIRIGRFTKRKRWNFL